MEVDKVIDIHSRIFARPSIHILCFLGVPVHISHHARDNLFAIEILQHIKEFLCLLCAIILWIDRLRALGIHRDLAQGDTAGISRLDLNLGYLLRAVNNHVEDVSEVGHDGVSSRLVGILHRSLHLRDITERDTQLLTLYVVGCRSR